MSTAMDMYLSSTDSLSLQDMLDIDIKSEIDILVGGHNDLSGFNFSELPPLELEEANDIRWISSNSNHSNSSFTLDFNSDYGSTMVNPNTVMPVNSTVSLAQSLRSPSPTLKESHLTFSPSTIKITNIKADATTVKKDLLNKLNNMDVRKPAEIQTVTKVTPITAKHIEKTANVRSNNSNSHSVLTYRNSVSSIVSISQSHNTISNSRMVTANRKHSSVNNRVYDEARIYPKPAYSYSCLIAMALKNSRTGSLPVSEIYNFMCRHFPYFKTAPNGWKNSVRHNLSLNKCFEKIEKPALNGSQRKGCLWAMNPAKIIKMDEEVQKWSRKDPSAIRKAMTNPENLEALERGELKFTYEEADAYDNFGDSCGSAESGEGSDSEPENESENNLDGETEFVELKSESDVEIENADVIYDEVEVDDDAEILQMEMALAQKELLQYERNVNNNNKRRRMYIIQQ